jgi:hypothetical protein
MYAEAVADVVPDDVGQGRAGETGIPHSDQWLDRGDKAPKTKFFKTTRRNILADNNGRAVPRGLSEELFQSRECFKDSPIQTAHNGYTHGGRYHFKLPSSWCNTLNKRIAVRRIETPANHYFIGLGIEADHYNTATPPAVKHVNSPHVRERSLHYGGGTAPKFVHFPPPS